MIVVLPGNIHLNYNTKTPDRGRIQDFLKGDALWSPAGNGLTSSLSFVVSNCEFVTSHWYPGSDVVLDCIDS